MMREALGGDLRYALRSLRRAPGFTIVAVLTLALGSGGTTAIFGFINSLLLRPLPVEAPDRIAAFAVSTFAGEDANVFTHPDYVHFQRSTKSLAGVAAFGMEPASMQLAGDAEERVVSFASGNYFQVLGLRAAAGRLLEPADERPGAAPVVVISHAFWQKHLAAAPSAVGSTLRLNGTPATIVGVAPAGFGGTINLIELDFWSPLGQYATVFPGAVLDAPNRSWLQVFGRIRDDASIGQARAELTASAGALAGSDARRDKTSRISLAPLQGLTGSARGGVLGAGAFLLATAMLVLLIASVNVVGVLLARAASRHREMGIRTAVGATPGRLAGQLLVESALLWVMGGAAGLLLAYLLTRAIPALLPPPRGFPVRIGLEASVDLRVVCFALVLSLVTGIGFGLVPALRASRVEPVEALRDARPSWAGRARLRGYLVMGQVAASVLLLVVAALFLRSFQRAWSMDPGFDPDNVSVASVNLKVRGYDEARGQVFYASLLQRLERLPGVESAGLGSSVPLDGTGAESGVTAHDRPSSPVTIAYTSASPGYLSTLGIQLLAGRDFTPQDAPDAPRVAIISRRLAERLWPGADPVGRELRMGGERAVVVGVAADVREGAFGGASRPAVYVPAAQRYVPQMSLLVRGHPAAAAQVRRLVPELDPGLPHVQMAPLRDVIVSILPHRLVATVVGIFGALGVLLAAVGLYGVLAYTVVQRTRELGVRFAVGATRGDVLWMVTSDGLSMAGTGIAVGLFLAFPAARLLSGALIDVSAWDPVTYLAVVAVLGAVALLASALPAFRASAIEPWQALRTGS